MAEDVTSPAPQVAPTAGATSDASAERALEDTFSDEAMASRDLKRALRTWRQGDLLDRIPIAWVAPPGHDPLTDMAAEELLDGRHPVVTWDEVAVDGDETLSRGRGWAIVTSQTCDIGTTGPGKRHPTVQVSPVVRVDGRMSASRIADAKSGAIVELVHVPEHPEEGDWFADLRLSMPVSKSVLAGAEPLHAFSHESQALDFAEKVGQKPRRPAVHDCVADDIVPELGKLITDAIGDGATWPDAVEQVRLEVVAGDRLWPTKIRLIVIGYSPLDADQRAPLRAWQKQRSKSLRKATRDAVYLPGGVQLIACRFTDLKALSVTDYRQSIPLGVEGLPDAFW